MCQHERMTTEVEKIQDYSRFLPVGDSLPKVLHLIANHLPNEAKKDDKQRTN